MLTGVDASNLSRQIRRGVRALGLALLGELPPVFGWTADQWRAYIKEQSQHI